ncbi:hypothetical protein [Arcobacter cloacae]|uniref:Phage abortive infection protein n=1 Tax=Arcobacter cloacae TaxID=1054034 RepID=A0A4Q0ZC33_9BACT|nr:hypothetical protein [Arcobacter cloacae]RXJ83833.1 hypothetical protein CRU90_08495 [Arcobacter cloacae]
MDNFLIIQIYMLFFLMFAIHVYFLFNKLFVKERKIKLNNSNILWILLGLFIITIVFGFFYNEFLINDNLKNEKIKDSIANWGAFGSYFGGFVAPILTFITLIILIKQISATQEANNLQIEHINKTRRIENLTERINYTVNLANEKIDKVHSLDENIVKIYIKNDKELSKQSLSLKSIINDYNNKLTNVTLSDDSLFPLEWQSIITYINMYTNEYENDAENRLDSFIKTEFHNILVLINKTIAWCIELLNLDEHSYQFVKFALINFTYTIEEAYKLGKIDKNKYEIFYKLISIHNNNEDSITENNLKKLFAKELSNKYDKNLAEKDLPNVNFRILDTKELKVGEFSVEIEGTTYLRIDGSWINGIELLEKRKVNKIS